MEIAASERDTEPGSVGSRPDAPPPRTLDEDQILKRARATFRFGSDGRLVAPPAPRPSPVGDRAALEAARSFVSDDPVLDECFEVALVFEAMAHFGRPAAPPEHVEAEVALPVEGPPPAALDPLVGTGSTEVQPSVSTAAEEPDPFVAVMSHLRDDLVADPSSLDPSLGDPASVDAAGERAIAETAAGGTAAHLLAAAGSTGAGIGVAGDDLGAEVSSGALDGLTTVPPARRRPLLEWPEQAERDAARSRRRDPVDSLASVLGTSPDVELAFAQTVGAVDAPMGMFRWPSGVALWTNASLDEWLLAGRPAERTLVAILDEWSQAHFLVRILPELLRRGRWRGQLQLAAASGRSETMLVTLVGHEDARGGTDAVSLFAMPIAPTTHPAAPASTVVPTPTPSDGLVRVDEPSSPPANGHGAPNGSGNGRIPGDPSGRRGATVGADRLATDQMFRALVQHVSDLIVVTDEHGRITFASPAAQALLDLAPASDGVRPNLLAIMHPDNRPTTLALLARQPDEAALPPHPMRVLGRDGSWRDLSGVLTDLTDAPAVRGYVLNARDVTDVVRAEQSITDQAYTDALTGLANRVRLLDRLEGNAHAVPRAPCALVVLGLDHLRRIDAEHGTVGVETVLATVGERLAQTAATLGADALAARLHSDEFALLLPGTDDVGAAVAAAGQVRLALREPIRLADQSVIVTASMGVATSVSATADDGFDEILARADLAMREAKSRGRDRTVAYDERLGDRQQHRRGIDQQLRRAIDSDGLRIQFQPIVELATGRIVAAEALLRVRGDGGELLSPGAFVEAAESNGLISRLGAAVLRTTCEQATALDLKPGGFPISVNVSPRQIADPGFARRVLTVLDETGLAPDRLSLEITEGAFVGRDDASETNIISLRDEGVRLGLDEFGGDASLGYLRRFPLDFVKIDRRLIAGLGANYVDGTIVRATIELAHKLGLLTVAVGVEHEEQQRRLEQLGCDRAQGYLFGGAVTSVELSALVHGRG